jgi:two-component system chemotaxis response regulator CheY
MKRVLVVDDAAFIRGSLRVMLEGHGFEVVGEAEDGEEALEQYVALKPDIVTMDVTMPGMDGLQALKKIKQLDKNAKVVMITALGKEDTVKQAILQGAANFIVKPFTAEGLLKVLNKV